MDLVKQCETVTRNAPRRDRRVKGNCRPLPRGSEAVVFQQSENCTQETSEVRKNSNDQREKIAARNSTTKTEQT